MIFHWVLPKKDFQNLMPKQPISRVLSSRKTGTVVIHLALTLRSGSCGLTRPASLLLQGFEGAPLDAGPIWPCSRWGLPSCPVTRDTGELLPFPLPAQTGIC